MIIHIKALAALLAVALLSTGCLQGPGRSNPRLLSAAGSNPYSAFEAVYDADGQLEELRYDSGRVEELTWEDGRIVGWADLAYGHEATVSYDGDNVSQVVATSEGMSPGIAYDEESLYTWENGQLTRVQQDFLFPEREEHTTTTFHYDEVGNIPEVVRERHVIDLVDPEGSVDQVLTSTRLFDDQGRLSGVGGSLEQDGETSTGDTFEDFFRYDDEGRLSSLGNESVELIFSYDDQSRLETISVGEEEEVSFELTYDDDAPDTDLQLGDELIGFSAYFDLRGQYHPMPSPRSTLILFGRPLRFAL